MTSEPIIEQHRPAELEADNDAAFWWRRYTECQDVIKAWTEASDDAKQHLQAILGESETLTLDGEPIIRWTSVTSSRLDQTLLKANYPEAYRNSKTSSTSRRFTLVKPYEAPGIDLNAD